MIVLILAVGMLTAATVGTAAAQQPDGVGAERWTEYGHEVFDLGCAFPIVEDNVAHWMVNPSGNLHLQGFYTLSNPVSGKSVTGNWSENWTFSDRGIQGAGLFWKATVPGYGIVLIDAGYRLYGGPPDFPLLIVRGPSSFASGGMAEFCDLLS
jgi:hypothetical protein